MNKYCLKIYYVGEKREAFRPEGSKMLRSNKFNTITLIILILSNIK